MKIGIITITDGANYGNRLQNYALQKVISSMGYDVETLQRRTDKDKTNVQKLKWIMKDVIKTVVGKKNTQVLYRKRKRLFEEFNAKYINFSDYTLSDNNAPAGIEDKYDYFVCGSDQIWNARFGIVKCDIKNYLAYFAKPGQRIAYAASFGTTDVAPGYETLFSSELEQFKSIGVRELSGTNIVKKLTGRNDVQTVLDPTMLLEKQEWKNLEKKPVFITNEKYIVTYFLGGRSELIEKQINLISERYESRVVNLDIEFLSDNSIDDRASYLCTPNEFVWSIEHAECVLTDSFHATVFSILFGKPFLTYQRACAEQGNDMGTRIDALLSMFELSDCKDNLNSPKKMPEKYDDAAVNRVLDTERQKSMNFLKKAIED